MRVLVGCEYSGVVRRAFQALGHDAWSCDLLPAEDNSPNHYQDDVLNVIKYPWDLAIFHPPCTYVCAAGLHWNNKRPERPQQTVEALVFVQRLLSCYIPKIALENPVGCISSRIRKPDQIIQPYQFGHPESKSTCLWLKGLPKLVATNVLKKPACGHWDNQTASGQNKVGETKNRWKTRSRTYDGIAAAFAAQWGVV